MTAWDPDLSHLTPIVVANQLRREFGAAPNRIVALNSISFQIDRASRVALVGRSGSGKTTLLNLLSGLDRPDSGSLLIGGQNLAESNRNQLAEFRLRQIGVVFQSFQLIPTKTALQNIELPLILAGVEKTARREISHQALQRVGLSDRVQHLPGQLSGGEQQRVAIARAIVNRPALLLADEPTGNLDTSTAASVMELLIDVITESQSTMLLITHDLALAERYTQCAMRLVDGSLTPNPAEVGS